MTEIFDADAIDIVSDSRSLAEVERDLGVQMMLGAVREETLSVDCGRLALIDTSKPLHLDRVLDEEGLRVLGFVVDAERFEVAA